MASHHNVFAQEKLASHHSDVFISEKMASHHEDVFTWDWSWSAAECVLILALNLNSVEAISIQPILTHRLWVRNSATVEAQCMRRSLLLLFFSFFFFLFFLFLDRFLLITVFSHISCSPTRDGLLLASRITVSAYRCSFRDVWISVTFYSIFVGMHNTL